MCSEDVEKIGGMHIVTAIQADVRKCYIAARSNDMFDAQEQSAAPCRCAMLYNTPHYGICELPVPPTPLWLPKSERPTTASFKDK